MPIYLTLQLAGGAARHVAVAPGGLLPRLFTLTCPRGQAVIFCHLNPEVAPSFPLRNAMLCVARTFLSRALLWRERQAAPLHLAAAKVQKSFYYH